MRDKAKLVQASVGWVSTDNIYERRERGVTLVCRFLSFGFDLPRRFSRRLRPQLVDIPLKAKVVIIKPCCLGDVLLATATLAALSEARPDLAIDFVVSQWSRPALEGNRRLRWLVATGTDGSHLSLRKYLSLARNLRRQKYAAALVLDRSPKLAFLPWLAGIPIRAGVDNLGRGFALNVRARQDGILQHEAEVYLDVARALGVKPTSPHLEFSPEITAAFWKKIVGLKINLPAPLAVIHPGGGQNPDTQVLSKRWPAARFGEIAARLVGEGFQVVIIGATSDKAVVETVVQSARPNGPTDGKLINGCGKFNLAETGALLTRASLFVGNDTGVMHLAAACGTAVVAIFGPSSPVAYGPYSAKGQVVAPGQTAVRPGLPLSEYQRLSAAEGGIEAVTVEMVWKAVQLKVPVS